MQAQRIKYIKSIGIKPCIDIEVNHSDHNFYAEGIVTQNSHSVSYSSLAAICIYLKLNYPKEFYFSCLKMAKYEQKRDECLFRINNEMRKCGIKMLPPNLKYSEDDFTIEKDGIRYGLAAIKGVSDSSLEKLKKFDTDNQNKFQTLESAYQAEINIGVLAALIQAGAMQEFGDGRSKLVLEAQLWYLLKDKERAYCLDRGEQNNFNLIEMIKNINEWSIEDKKVARASRYNTIKKTYEKNGYKQIYEKNSEYEDFASYMMERRLLGFSYSTNLRDVFVKECPELMSIEEFESMEENTQGTFVGVVSEVIDTTSKKGNLYTKIIMDDGTGILTTNMFSDNRAKIREEKGFPKEGNVIVVKGKRWNNILTLFDLSIQDEKVYLKMGDFKNDDNKDENNKENVENSDKMSI